MSKREWREITVYWADGMASTVQRKHFEILDQVAPVLEAMRDLRKMKHELDRILGEAPD